jgi:AraC-like DNA-binding protein
LIYLFGHIGIYKFSILKERNIIRKFLLLESKPVHYPKDKSGYRADLIRIIEEEKGYLNPSFSLKTLSKDLGISQSHLSRIFKTEFDTSFTTYINSLRISNAKTFLSNSDFSNYTLVAIGLEAGFNSKTTFNTTFKKYTGKTPSEYRKAHQNT